MTREERGLLAGWAAACTAPVLWSATTQLGQVLPYADCAARQHWTAFTTLAAAMLALVGCGICWRNRPFSRTGRFACAVGSMLGLVLAFAMLMQASAGILLTGCER